MGAIGPQEVQAERGQQSVEQLREQLAEAKDQAWEMELRLRETLSSTSFRLGQSLVLAAKNPRRLRNLPAELWRLYRGRGTREDVFDYEASRVEELFSRYRSLAHERGGPLIGVVASRHALRSLGAAFDVVPLWPHNANEVAGAVSPDVVLIESGAAMPGQAWSALGTAIEAGLEDVLIEVIEGYQQRSVPILFWWTTPLDSTSDLSHIARRCDCVASDDSIPGVPDASSLSLGVDLGQLDPTPPSARRDALHPLLHLGAYEPDPRIAPANRLVGAAVAAGAGIFYEPGHLHASEQTLWHRDVRSRYRAASWSTPTTDRLSHRCIAMLASGIPVLVTNVPDEFRSVVTEVPPGGDITEAVVSARQRIESPGAMAQILRAIHLSGTTRGRVTGQLQSLGITTTQSDDGGVGVLIEACSGIEDAVTAINAQSMRPTEVLVEDADTRRRWTDTAQLNIPARPPVLGESSRHVLWRGNTWPKTYLHDLLVASLVVGTDCFSDSDGIVMVGSSGLETPLPWWIRGGSVVDRGAS